MDDMTFQTLRNQALEYAYSAWFQTHAEKIDPELLRQEAAQWRDRIDRWIAGEADEELEQFLLRLSRSFGTSQDKAK